MRLPAFVFFSGCSMVLHRAAAQCPDLAPSGPSIDSIHDPIVRREAYAALGFHLEHGLPDSGSAPLHMAALKSFSDSSVAFSGHGMWVEYAKKPFIATDHVFSYDLQYPGFVCAIDGHAIYGTDGNVPLTELAGLRVIVDGVSIDLAKSSVEDLYEPSLHYHDLTGHRVSHGHVTRSIDHQRVYIHISGGDAAGSYDVLFVILKGRFFARYIAHNC